MMRISIIVIIMISSYIYHGSYDHYYIIMIGILIIMIIMTIVIIAMIIIMITIMIIM